MPITGKDVAMGEVSVASEDDYQHGLVSWRGERMSMGGDEEVNLASEDYYQQHTRVWKFRSENLDEEEFEVAAAGSGWRDEDDCDNFQRFIITNNLPPN